MRISPVFETLIWLSPPNEKVDICAAATLVNQPPTFAPSFDIHVALFDKSHICRGAAYEACNGRMDEEIFSRMITDTMNSPLYKKAFGAKDPFVAEKQKKKVAAFKVANEISDSEYNWQTDYTPGRDETEYFCTYRKCGLCALGRKYGHPELIKHMCQMDYISIDMMGGVLYRTKTLATGGDCCDFHVVKKGSKWIEK